MFFFGSFVLFFFFWFARCPDPRCWHRPALPSAAFSTSDTIDVLSSAVSGVFFLPRFSAFLSYVSVVPLSPSLPSLPPPLPSPPLPFLSFPFSFLLARSLSRFCPRLSFSLFFSLSRCPCRPRRSRMHMRPMPTSRWRRTRTTWTALWYRSWTWA